MHKETRTEQNNSVYCFIEWLIFHMLTLWPVAGLGVAALHSEWFGVGVTMVHGV